MKFLNYIYKTVKFLLLVFCVFLASLCFRELRIPADWVEHYADNAIGPNLVLHLGKVSFGFRRGLVLENVRVFNRQAKEPTRAMCSAELVSIDLLTRTVRLVRPVYDRLPDGYYEPGYAYGPRSLEKQDSPPWDIQLPDLPPFTLVLERPNGVGAQPEQVVGTVNMDPTRVDLTDIRLRWPRRNGPLMTITGYLGFDLAGKRIYGEIDGAATQALIRPLLEVLDVTSALPYIDAFTEVQGPIPAYYSWDADLETGRTTMVVKVRPTLGRYNGVKMRDADGKITLEFWYKDGGFCFDTTIGPVIANDRQDRALKGMFKVEGRNGVITLVLDAESGIDFTDLLTIIDTLNDGLLDRVKFPVAPHIQMKGTLAPVVERQSENNLHGVIEAPEAILWHIPVHGARTDFAYEGSDILFTNVTGTCARGGTMYGWAKLSVPGFDEEKSRIECSVDYRDGSLEEIADFLKFDLGDRKGKVECDLYVNGPLNANFMKEADGHGRIKVADGHLAQMAVFAGLTQYLADYVPGFGNVVNQNTGSCSFKLEGGKFITDDLIIEGDIFSITAKGAYDIVNDNLDFMVSVTLLREQSLVGKYILHPLLYPITKSFLEFRVNGPMDNPDWKFVNILEKEWFKSEGGKK